MKNLSLPVWIVLLLVVGAIVALTSMRLSRDGATPVIPSSRPEVVPAQVDAPRASAQSAPILGTQAPEDTEAERKQAQEASRQIVDTGRDLLFNQYRSEKVDGGWALAKQQRLESFKTSEQIASMDVEPQSMTVDCRSSVCRIEARFATRVAADDWTTLYALNAGSELPNMSSSRRRDADGSTVVEIYAKAR